MPEIWPFPPQGQVNEALSWQTDLIRCKSAEQRISLRNIPRTLFDYDYQFTEGVAEAATQLARQNMDLDIYVPIWTEGEYVGALSSGATFIPVDTTDLRYKAAAHVFIIGDDNAYEIVEIAAVQAAQLDLVTPYVTIGYERAFIAPCFLCKMKGPLGIGKLSADYMTARASFLYDKNFGDTGSHSFPAFNSSYVMTDRSVLVGVQREIQEREVKLFPNLAGPVHYDTTYEYAISKGTIAWSFDTAAEIKAFRSWLFVVKGKQGSFYLPRWTRDFVLNVAIGSADTSITVLANTDASNAYLGAICIAMKDGTQYYGEITSWDPQGGGQHVANLASSFGVDIAIADVEMITRMPKMRLDNDTVTFAHLAGQKTTVRMSVMEVPA